MRTESPIASTRFFAGAVRAQTGALAGEYLPGHTSMIRRDPLGVVASIAPWNYPILMAGWKIGPALVTGNTVVLKPSARAPLTALMLGRIAMEEEIFPEGVCDWSKPGVGQQPPKGTWQSF